MEGPRLPIPPLDRRPDLHGLPGLFPPPYQEIEGPSVAEGGVAVGEAGREAGHPLEEGGGGGMLAWACLV